MRRVPVIEIGLIEMPASRWRSVPPLASIHAISSLRVVRALLVLDAGVEVLGVLAHDHEVDVVEARADARVGLARAHLRVEVEALAQADVDRAEAAADRRRDRALERDPVAPDRVERLVGQRVAAVRRHHVLARLADVPVELDAGRLEHAARRLGELGAGAVAGDEHDPCATGRDSSGGRRSCTRWQRSPPRSRCALRRRRRRDRALVHRRRAGRAHVPRLRHRRSGRALDATRRSRTSCSRGSLPDAAELRAFEEEQRAQRELPPRGAALDRRQRARRDADGDAAHRRLAALVLAIRRRRRSTPRPSAARPSR